MNIKSKFFRKKNVLTTNIIFWDFHIFIFIYEYKIHTFLNDLKPFQMDEK